MTLDVFPAAKTSIVHPHQRAMREGMAVVFGKGTLSGRADVTEYETGRRLGRQALQVRAVPGGYCGCEEAGRRAQLGVGIEPYAEAICVVLASSRVLQAW
jgi:hypothetical protein